MNTAKDLIFRNFKVNRQSMEKLGDRIKNGEMKYKNPADKMYDYNIVFGGKCFYCKKEWKKKNIKNSMSDYYIYEPNCNCYERRNNLRKERNKRIEFYIRADIPPLYIKSNLLNMNKDGLAQTTINAIEKTKNYIKQKLYNKMGLILFGQVGTGKSHAGISVLKYLIIKEQKKCKFISMSDIVTNIINNDFDYIQDLTSNYDAVMFDDMDKMNVGKIEQRSEWTAERMFSLFDGMVRNKKIIIATSNCETLEEFSEKFDRAIVSRLAGECELIKFVGKDYRLLRKARGRNEN